MSERQKARQGRAGRKRSWPETYAKDILGTILEHRGRVVMEHEIVERRLRADMLFVPDPGLRGQEDLGIVERMLELGQCLIEVFSRPPVSAVGFHCMGKQQSEHARMCNQARRNREPEPPCPRLWMISPGQPRTLMKDMLFRPMEGWPTGFWHVGGKYHVHLIVVRDLPATPDTLLLRLLDHDERLHDAMAELDELPRDWPLRQRLVPVALTWQIRMATFFGTNLMMSPKTKALYDEWENKVLAQGREQGREQGLEQGIEQGLEQGKRALLRKQLMLRFGALPAEAEKRLERGTLDELELWAERVLSADNLAAVFAR